VAYIDVAGEVRKFLEEHTAGTGRRKKTIFESSGITMFLLCAKENDYVPPHKAPDDITVQVVAGQVRMNVKGVSHILDEQTILFVGAGVEHDVFGLRNSVCLVTMAKQSTSPAPSQDDQSK
jgi:quercetin dioxygenase-like cupin family protein